MKHRLAFIGLSLLIVCLALVPTALASNTWYVDGVNGNDSNNCKSATTACKTIGHAISLASSGDSIMVAAATYTENLTIGINLRITGSGASSTIIDGGGVTTVVTISSANAHVALSGVAIRNGSSGGGGGISNGGTLTINKCTISGNSGAYGGGILSDGTLTINNSTLSGNTAFFGGGIHNTGALVINNSTLSGNYTTGSINYGGAIFSTGGPLTINNSTFSGNSARTGGGIYSPGDTATLQNSIVANSSSGGNCWGTMTSNGYNLSSDSTCNFNNTGDLNNTDPKLGPLQNNGGPTETMALFPGSPAIDAGNPSGCTDGRGHLLKTDQRGTPRPDKEDSGGCDMGAYERQTD
jgi:predicted outer membrane repeat protein